MSTGVIIAIVVVVLLLIGLLVLMPRMRAKAEERKTQKELDSRRDRVATEHRETASMRAGEADRAEQEAEIAQQKARAQRAESERHESEAKLHERGLADDQLVEDHERDRFSGVTGANGAAASDSDQRTDADPARTEGDERPAAPQATGEDEAARRDSRT
jgi:uncharacterized membrane-anchored protein YhcB (DUF1043 family)